MTNYVEAVPQSPSAFLYESVRTVRIFVFKRPHADGPGRTLPYSLCSSFGMKCHIGRSRGGNTESVRTVRTHMDHADGLHSRVRSALYSCRSLGLSAIGPGPLNGRRSHWSALHAVHSYGVRSAGVSPVRSWIATLCVYDGAALHTWFGGGRS